VLGSETYTKTVLKSLGSPNGILKKGKKKTTKKTHNQPYTQTTTGTKANQKSSLHFRRVVEKNV